MGYYGLEIAKTGLYVSQTAIEAIGQNISNSATEGYTRQRVETASVEAGAQGGRYAAIVTRAVGGGVDIQAIRQVRDAYIDRELRRECSDFGKWETQTNAMSYIESLFDETSEYSISSVMSEFFDSLGELSTDATSLEIRTTVQQNAIQLTGLFDHYYTQLTELQDEQNDNMYTTVQAINDTLERVADYNLQIYSYELSGDTANDLRDKRNLLLDDLSKLVNIEYYENSEKQLVVTVEGVELVNHTDLTKLETVADQTGIVSGQTGYYSIYYEGTMDEFLYSSGELFAYRAMRDGNSVDDVGIPRLMDGLNTLCQSIAEAFNDVHSAGYTLATESTASQMGINFFAVPIGGYGDITAGNFSLSDEILGDVYNIAASSELVDLSAGNTNEGNNENILEMVALCTSDEIAGIGNFEDYYSSVLSELAISSRYCGNMYQSQASIVSNLETRKESVSGVSINEEMIEMIKYQHAYAASSRLITVIDEMLDTLINGTGAVGR